MCKQLNWQKDEKVERPCLRGEEKRPWDLCRRHKQKNVKEYENNDHARKERNKDSYTFSSLTRMQKLKKEFIQWLYLTCLSKVLTKTSFIIWREWTAFSQQYLICSAAVVFFLFYIPVHLFTSVYFCWKKFLRVLWSYISPHLIPSRFSLPTQLCVIYGSLLKK